MPVSDNIYIILSKYKSLKNTLEKSSEIIEILNNNINHVQPEFIHGYISGNSLIGISNIELSRLEELLKWMHKN